MKSDEVQSATFKKAKAIVAGIFVLLGIFFLFSILFSVLELPFSVAILYPGKLLFTAYGYSSFLISGFLLVATIFLLLPGWNYKVAIMLAFSILPFFTMVKTEQIMTAVPQSYLVSILSKTGVFAGGFLLSIIEYSFMYFVLRAIFSPKTKNEQDKSNIDDYEEYDNEISKVTSKESTAFDNENSTSETKDYLDNKDNFENEVKITNDNYDETEHTYIEEFDLDSEKSLETLRQIANRNEKGQEENSVQQEELANSDYSEDEEFSAKDSEEDTLEAIPYDVESLIQDLQDEDSASATEIVQGENTEKITQDSATSEILLSTQEEKSDNAITNPIDDTNSSDNRVAEYESVLLGRGKPSSLFTSTEEDETPTANTSNATDEIFTDEKNEAELSENNFANEEDLDDEFDDSETYDDDIDIIEEDYTTDEEQDDSYFDKEFEDNEFSSSEEDFSDESTFEICSSNEISSEQNSSSEGSSNEGSSNEEGQFDSFCKTLDSLKESFSNTEEVAPQAEKPKKKLTHYSVPVNELLTSYPDGQYWIIDDATRDAAVVLKQTLNEFKIQAEVTGIRKGPVITMFEILPASGVKLQRIVALQDNIALRLAASSIRIIAPIPGKHAVGIEIPNSERAIVSFKELIEAEPPSAKKMEIPVVLGKDITGEAIYLDLATTPHLLIAGSTGAGKSVCVNSMILSILYKRSPQDVRMMLIDPKIVELKLYNDIPHLLTPVITESKKAFQALQYCICEMERRYALLDGMGVRDIKSYNKRIKERQIATEKLPYIVVIIDEFADLMATTGKELESTVARLCAMSRAVGIHLVLATQRPSIDVITGLIKANIPSRIAFMVASKMDSRIIIDQVGAEKLLGKGDMLYASATAPFPVRIQGAFVTDNEVEKVAEYVRQFGEPEYIDDEIFFDEDEEDTEPSLFSDGEDPLYDKALEIVMQAGKASASYIQRRLKIGYNRAARLVEDMEARGIVGPPNGSKPREVIHHV